jgi:ABC-type uncharacterized transport system auxiliary subunit
MRALIIIMIALLFSACSSSGKKTTEKLYYRFPESIITTNKQVIVKRPSAMGIIGNRPMVVQSTDGSLKQMNNNFWLDSPKVLLHNYLSKIFAQPVTAEVLILNSQILKFEKKQDQALFEIKFTVSDNKGNVVFNKTYNRTSTKQNNSVSVFVSAIGEMLEQSVQALVDDLQ